MIIKKIGHCCLLVRSGPDDTTYILTDPGNFSREQDTVKHIGAVVITHEHEDHFHLKSLQQILKNNPVAKVITNASVGKKLDKVGIRYQLLRDGEDVDVNGTSVQAFAAKHEEIYEEMNQAENTAFGIGSLLLPGDSFFDPPRGVNILALPVAGPWCKIGDAIRYALKVKPKMAFPIHDGMLQRERIGAAYRIPEKVLNENGIKFITMGDGKEYSFYPPAGPQPFERHKW
ncbi:MAG TPA: MBL fold metallo-hydrolase [Rhabdochlamydiaceae bacterium]